MTRPAGVEQGHLHQAGITGRPSEVTVSFLTINIRLSFPHPLNLVERPYDPRPYDSRYSRDYDDRRGGGGGRGGRYDDYRGGGRDYDRPRDYDRGNRDRGGYGRDKYDDRRY